MIKELLKQKPSYQTIFTYAEVAQITGKSLGENLIASINYYVRAGDLIRLSKGLYALDEDYSRFELGNKLRTPSYVSFYTVLSREGIVFQPYETFYFAANRSEEVVVQAQKFKYRKLKDEILLNDEGLYEKNGIQYATKERALLDKIYLDKEEYFDNLAGIDWEKMRTLNENVYRSKRLQKYILDMKNA